MYGDLHIHTNISDGSLSLDETLAIVNSTHQANPVVISIVDHNIFATRSVVKRENTLIIPGIELSATEDEINVHLTAYFKDVIDTSPLGQYLQKINDGYMARARSMYEKIVSKGFAMPPFEEIRSADLPPPIYSHNMFEAFRRVNSEEVFERQKNTQLFYVEENNFLPTIKEMIDAVHTMNGIIFWAHPGTRFLKNEDDKSAYQSILKALISYGLDGIEAYYPKHTKAQQAQFLKDAATYELLVSGGSDFHGEYGSTKNPEFILPDKDVDKILERLSISK